MQFVIYALYGVGIYIAIYSIIDRICKYKESTSLANLFTQFAKYENMKNKEVDGLDSKEV